LLVNLRRELTDNAADQHVEMAHGLLLELAAQLGPDLVEQIIAAPQIKESEIRAQRIRVAELKVKLLKLDNEKA